MNCPHCGSDCRAEPCLGRMTTLVNRSLDLTRSLGRCNHCRTLPVTIAKKPGAVVVTWCQDCGAVKGLILWRLPEGAQMAQALTGELPSETRGTVEPVRPEDAVKRGRLQ